MKAWKILLVTAGLALASVAGAQTQLNALFMKQAAYSEDDIKAMTGRLREGQS